MKLVSLLFTPVYYLPEKPISHQLSQRECFYLLVITTSIRMDVVIILFTAIIAYVIDGLGTRLTRHRRLIVDCLSKY